MKLFLIICTLSLFAFAPKAFGNENVSNNCIPLDPDKAIILECFFSTDSSNDTLCNIRLRIADEIKGVFKLNDLYLQLKDPQITATSEYQTLILQPYLDIYKRSCYLTSEYPLKKKDAYKIHIPEGILVIKPDFVEVDDIDIDEELLTSLSIAGAWHKPGSKWSGQGLFSIIDDDSLDGQIKSSKHAQYTYGYYSLLFPLLESLGLRGNLAVEGRKIGIDYNPPYLNDNGKTLLRLQNEKGWDLLCHSMDCLGENMNNWMVDSLDSPLANALMEEGPNYGESGRTVTVFDLKTKKQYWPNAENTEWVVTPKRFIKPYISNYKTKKDIMYNPEYCIDWHWAEWKKRAENFGIHPAGFVTHNSTSSHALVAEIIKVFPYGLSDIGAININFPPMLSSGVRAGLEGQSLPDYDGNSKDNTFNKSHFQKFCSQIDETRKNGGWIIFNLHAYRDCWLNSLAGKLVSEGGTYPDEWVIPMKDMDSANDPLSPPSHLGISNWSEWYPCPGTRLEMMWKLLKYAKEKGLRNVTCSEGFNIMGNKKSAGYFNQGYKFGKDYFGLWDTDNIYPHYVVSASGEISYYNTLKSKEYVISLDELTDSEFASFDFNGQFLISQDSVQWYSPDPTGISIKALDFTGIEIKSSFSNKISLVGFTPGVYIICAMKNGKVISTKKIATH